MKVFAILTASLMIAGGTAYFLQDSCSPCHNVANCPSATTGGCCASEQPSCCPSPCSGCETECPNCCTLCELYCTAGAEVPVTVQTATEETCCAACTNTSPARFAADAANASATVK